MLVRKRENTKDKKSVYISDNFKILKFILRGGVNEGYREMKLLYDCNTSFIVVIEKIQETLRKARRDYENKINKN